MSITPNWVHKTHQVPTIEEHLCAQLQVTLNYSKKNAFSIQEHICLNTLLFPVLLSYAFLRRNLLPIGEAGAVLWKEMCMHFFLFLFFLMQIEWRREMQVFFSTPFRTPSLNWKSMGWFPVLCIRVWWIVLWISLCLQLKRCHHLISHRWTDSHETAAFSNCY